MDFLLFLQTEAQDKTIWCKWASVFIIQYVLTCVLLRVRWRSSELACAVKIVSSLKAAASMGASYVTMATCGTARVVSSACVNGVRCCANGSSVPDRSAHGYVSKFRCRAISRNTCLPYSLKETIKKLSWGMSYIPPLKMIRAKYSKRF